MDLYRNMGTGRVHMVTLRTEFVTWFWFCLNFDSHPTCSWTHPWYWPLNTRFSYYLKKTSVTYAKQSNKRYNGLASHVHNVLRLSIIIVCYIVNSQHKVDMYARNIKSQLWKQQLFPQTQINIILNIYYYIYYYNQYDINKLSLYQ